jgi:hypothetical protein
MNKAIKTIKTRRFWGVGVVFGGFDSAGDGAGISSYE